ncbi:hypothetical protein LWI28_021470 [Acer negundo]|uniref:RING-type domain-containing protein n=1 Tax=Acer negundo TaxID=4023 RepID=A0AAD5IVT7_ACENE|nr:hypothetical protein LWI28_021470 [Acer negundo]KAK4845591.1 hypothetical protein QYF36_006830 [Acer negundo]
MNGTVERSMTWKNLKQRLGFKGMGCLGIKWTSTTQTITILEQQEEEQQQQQLEQERIHMQLDQRFRVASGMNLATALEVERNLRGDGGEDVTAAVGLPMNNSAGNTTSTVKSLMMLIEETDGDDWKQKKKKEQKSDVAVCGVGPVVGNDWLCCVCMERNKGAAFIPCGHAFCRVCSRELWLNRGSCAVCNRSILQILDIF